ncbi:S-layer family protein, partial [Lentimicrobium sp. S6]|uniref:beta strand repeat-containing protein n=1 Tax=Lentimicrobium sp. S6 TaxID=2735872 RepID=UPI001556C0E1
MKFVANTNISAGEECHVDATALSYTFTSGSTPLSISSDGAFSPFLGNMLGTFGDNLFIYQTGPTNVIAGLSADNGIAGSSGNAWFTSATSSTNGSVIPTGKSNASNGFLGLFPNGVNSEVDNAQYKSTSLHSGDKAALLVDLMDINKWEFDNSTLYSPSTTPFTVTGATPPVSASITAQSNVACPGGNNGSLTATASDGSPNFSYVWSNGSTTTNTASTTNTILSLAAGTYTVTITDDNGTSTASTTLSTLPDNTPPVITVCASTPSNIPANASCQGTAPNLTGSVTATDNCTSSPTITQSPAAGATLGLGTTTITLTATCTVNQTVVDNTTPVITVCASTPNDLIGNSSNQAIMTDLTTLVTAIDNCTGSPIITQSPASGATLGLGVTIITLTATDGSGNSATCTVNQTVISGFGVTISSQTNVNCYGSSTGSLTATTTTTTTTTTTGVPNYSYLWSNGYSTSNTASTTNTLSSISAGTYTVTVTDNSGQTATASATVSQPSAVLSASITAQTNIDCNGGSNASATAAGSGGTSPYIYAWSNAATTAAITGVSAGAYTVTITDNNGCTDTETVTITEPTTLVAAAVVDANVSCNSGSDGGATASATGGTSPYTYLWSNAATTAAITGVAAGTYTVTVTDANGCTDTESVTITEPATLVAAAVVDANVSCNGGSDGAATASATGATSPYTYLWSNAATTAAITGIAAATYTVTITDNNGCTDSESVIITEPEMLIVNNVITTNASGCAPENPSISILASGGTPAYMYSIDHANTWQTSNLFEDLAAGNYDIYVKDANGCISGWGTTIHVNEPAPIVITLDGITNVDCNGNSTGVIHMTVSGGTPDFTYEWVGPDGFTASTESINELFPGDYVLTVTDQNACVEISGPHTVIEPLTALSIDEVTSMDVTICAGNMNGSIAIVASGGTPTYLYSIDNGTTYHINPLFEDLGPGVYKILVRDANGCETVLDETVTITEPAAINIVAVDVVNVMGCFGDASGEIHIDATGGTGVLKYSIDNGATYHANGGIFTGLVAGTYQVKVKDMNGCRVLYDMPTVITEPALLEVVEVILTDVSGCYGNTNGMIEVAA